MTVNHRHVVLAATTLTSLPQLALAQSNRTPVTPNENSQIVTQDDIVVMARRTPADVPLAISAIGPAQLEQNNIQRVTDLNGSVPSLTVAPGQGSGRANPTFVIRGIIGISPEIVVDLPVGVYFNDVAVQRTQGVNLGFFDIASPRPFEGCRPDWR